MPIVKRSRHTAHTVLVRNFYEEEGKKIITAQRRIETPVRSDKHKNFQALVDGLWLACGPVDAEKRGGVEYEVYLEQPMPPRRIILPKHKAKAIKARATERWEQSLPDEEPMTPEQMQVYHEYLVELMENHGAHQEHLKTLVSPDDLRKYSRIMLRRKCEDMNLNPPPLSECTVGMLVSAIVYRQLEIIETLPLEGKAT